MTIVMYFFISRRGLTKLLIFEKRSDFEMKTISIREYASQFHDICDLNQDDINLSLIEEPAFPARKPVSHKYSYGRALIIGGSKGYSGAPALAANACERSGAGLTHLMVPENIYTVAAIKCDGAVVTPLPESANRTVSREAMETILEALKTANACAIGPGLGHGKDAEYIVENVVRNASCPLILDADAITISGRNPELIQSAKAPLILTPHEGEFRRLGGDLSNGRLEGALCFSKNHPETILVLKGYGTLVCSGGNVSVNPTGGPAMAKGGSGDVLCGIICALAAQGFGSLCAATSGVYIHGAAGDLAAEQFGEYSVTPSDLIRFLPEVFKKCAFCVEK